MGRQSPFLRGPDHVYELANAAYSAIIAGRQVVGTPIREALPELAGQGVYELRSIPRLRDPDEPSARRALRLMIVRQPGTPAEECYFDFVYQPMRDATGAIDQRRLPSSSPSK